MSNCPTIGIEKEHFIWICSNKLKFAYLRLRRRKYIEHICCTYVGGDGNGSTFYFDHFFLFVKPNYIVFFRPVNQKKYKNSSEILINFTYGKYILVQIVDKNLSWKLY
jgi:hypothetical protein